jgi:hypothetical protein
MSISHRVLSALIPVAEGMLRLVGITSFITTDGGDVDQGGRRWHEMGRTELNDGGERTYWGLGLYAIAGNTKVADRWRACPVRRAAYVAARDAEHRAIMAECAAEVAA